jgi:hypothetical protein
MQMQREFERRRLRVYVAGPISSDVFDGVHRGFAAGKQMFLDGMAPFIPHADAFWFMSQEVPGDQLWKAYLEYDLEYVSVCDAVFRLAGESKGADLECDIAKALRIPVFTQLNPDRPLVEDVGYARLCAEAAWRELNGKQVAS